MSTRRRPVPAGAVRGAAPQPRGLVSFVRLTRRWGAGPAAKGVSASRRPRWASRHRVRTARASGADTYSSFSATAARFTRLVSSSTRARAPRTIYLARLVRSVGPSRPIVLERHGLRAGAAGALDRLLADARLASVGRRSWCREWRRARRGAQSADPEPAASTWRYSLGNAYEAFEFPESLEEPGRGAGRVRFRRRRAAGSSRPPSGGSRTCTPNWEAGSRLARSQPATRGSTRTGGVRRQLVTPAPARDVGLARAAARRLARRSCEP